MTNKPRQFESLLRTGGSARRGAPWVTPGHPRRSRPAAKRAPDESAESLATRESG
jgi:hypothetical protein